MNTLAGPRNLVELQSALPEVQYPFSLAYRSTSKPEEYAAKIDANTLFTDFLATARAFALNPNHLRMCAHNAPGMIVPIRNSDPKIDAGLKRFPGVLAQIIQSERLKAVHTAREALHNAIAHK